MRYLNKLGNRGDTIVEVMIVLAVLGMAISIAYSTAGRSLSNARQAQENQEASKLLESQAEEIRFLRHDPTIYAAGTFCIIPNTDPLTLAAKPFVRFNIIPATANPAECAFSTQYNVKIVHTLTTVGALQIDKFTLNATWDNIRGLGTDSTTLNYRQYQ